MKKKLLKGWRKKYRGGRRERIARREKEKERRKKSRNAGQRGNRKAKWNHSFC